jgi:hypothetical protein
MISYLRRHEPSRVNCGSGLADSLGEIWVDSSREFGEGSSGKVGYAKGDLGRFACRAERIH